MVMVKALKGLRPKKDLVAQVASPPYDVLSADEAQALAANNPISFLYVEKMEISLPPGADPDGDEAAQAGKRNLQRLIDEHALVQDDKEMHLRVSAYLAWHASKPDSCCSRRWMIIFRDKSSATNSRAPTRRPDARAWRKLLMRRRDRCSLFYPSADDLDLLLAEVAKGQPEYDFEADDVRHQLWVVDDARKMTRR